MSDGSRALSGKQQARDRSDRFAAFRATRTAMLVTDPRRHDNPIIFANDAFSSLTGYTEEEALGRNWRFLGGPETDPAEMDRICRAVADGEPVEAEILNYRKDGASFLNALAMSPIPDEAGRLLFVVASLSEIGDGTPGADAHRVPDGLEQEVARRMVALEAALEQQGMLLREVDHRVKNNLQVIASVMLLEARRIKDKDAQNVLNSMAERISALSTVYRLLYSSGEGDRLDIGEFARELSADLTKALGHSRVELVLRTQSVAIAAARATSVALLLNELISKAFKHAFPKGRKGRLTVGVEPCDGAVRILVEDNGVGIAAQVPSDETFGRTLIDMLVRQLRAHIHWEDANPGTRAVVTMPVSSEETRS
jgi:PAS domain S-box-containing protein